DSGGESEFLQAHSAFSSKYRRMGRERRSPPVSGEDVGDDVEHVFSIRLEVLVDTEELGQNEQDAPLAWFGAQPPPRSARCSPPSRSSEFLEDDPTLPRSFLR
ncbi:unnamed protein product, partial [Ectocarpus sp. 12 AP-2014]